MQRLLCPVSFLIVTLVACEIPTESRNGPGQILDDTLTVTIVRDETPGFLYPLMRHDIHFVGHLDVSGFIDQYSYESQDVGFGVIADYSPGYMPARGTKFRFRTREWSQRLQEAGRLVAYEFSARSPFAKVLVRASSVQVRAVNDGPLPAQNSEQLTGPDHSNSRPVFTRDGEWIYYQGWDSDNRTYSINRIPAHGGIPETVLETAGNMGGFTLTQGDSILTYVAQHRDAKSDLVQRHLHTGAETIIPIDGFIWDAALVAIPETRHFVSLADPNVVESDLILIDAEQGTVEVLFSQEQDGPISHYDHRPGTDQISVVVGTGPYQSKVILLNVDTRERTTFLPSFPGYELVWGPNGEDYTVTKVTEAQGVFEQNIYLNQAGVEQQLTRYPGTEEQVAFSPDGRSLAYLAIRRSEHQIWRLAL